MKKTFLYALTALVAVFAFTAFEDAMTPKQEQEAKIMEAISEKVNEFIAEKEAECTEKALQLASMEADSIYAADKSVATKVRTKKPTPKPKPRPTTTTTTTTTTTVPTTPAPAPKPAPVPSTKPTLGKGTQATEKPKPILGKGKGTTTDGKPASTAKPILGKGKKGGGN